MATFLELCQQAAGLSGTIDRRTVSTVDATGRIRILADLVRDGWTDIQNLYRAWRFLTVEFPEATELGEGISAFEASALNLQNWGSWIPGTDPGTIPLTIWPAAAEGEAADAHRAQEVELSFVDYRDFRQAYQTGASRATPAATPRAFSIDPLDRLVVWPTPERTYRLAGTYRRSAQELREDADVPIILPAYHDAIVWNGVLLLHRHDEAEADVLFTTQQGLDTRMAALRRRYLKATVLGYTPLGAAERGSVRSLSTVAPT